MSPHTERSVSEIRTLLQRATGLSLSRLCDELADDPRAGVIAAVETARRRDAAQAAERSRLSKLYHLEASLRQQGYLVVAGIDEVGRGALAGPLTAGACVLPANPKIQGINDSKQLTPARREQLAHSIKEIAVCWSVAHVSPDEIDSLGVTAALKRVMGRALAALDLEPDHVVVDGRPLGIAREETAVVKGDSKVAAVAAASILAKVCRDELMVSLAPDHPHYGFDVNKGYGTAEHLDAIALHGLSSVHRRSFAPGGGTATLF